MRDSGRVNVTPIFITVKEAAQTLAISDWTMYQILNRGDVASQYQGRRRLVSYSSLQDYAASLPTTPSAEESA